MVHKFGMDFHMICFAFIKRTALFRGMDVKNVTYLQWVFYFKFCKIQIFFSFIINIFISKMLFRGLRWYEGMCQKVVVCRVQK